MNYYSRYNDVWLPSEPYQINALNKFIETNNPLVQMDNPIFESKFFKFSIIKNNYRGRSNILYQYVVVYSTESSYGFKKLHTIKVQMIKK